MNKTRDFPAWRRHHPPAVPRAALVLVAAALTLRAGASAAPEKVTLQLKWHHQFQFAGYYAADLKGFFADEGLEVTLLEGNSERPPLETVLNGGADFGVGDGDILVARMRGEPVVACATIFQHSPYVLISRADSGIRHPADLEGRSLMVSGEQGAAQVLEMLRRAGVPDGGVRILPHSWNLADLAEGRVDAISGYATAEPSQLRAMGIEPAVMRASEHGVDFYGDTLFTTERMIASRGGTVEAMTRATKRGWLYAMENPEEIIAHILTLPGVAARGLDVRNLEFEAAEMRGLILPDIVGIGHMDERRWLRMAEVYRASRSAGTPEAPDWFDGFLFAPSHWSRDLGRVGAAMAGLVLVGLAAWIWSLTLRRRVNTITDALRRGERKLQALLDNSSNVLALLRPDGRLVEANRTAQEFVGAGRGRVLGKRFGEDPWWNEPPALGQRLAAGVARVAGGEAVVRMDGRHPGPHGDGRLLDFALRAVPDEAGGTEFIVAEGIDITRLKEVEREAVEREGLTRLILDSAPDAVIGVDVGGLVVHWNARAGRLFGVAADQALGTSVRRFLPELDAHLAGTGDGRREAETSARRADGTSFPAELSWSALPEGKSVALNLFVRDTTKRRQLEEQLRQSQKLQAIGQLAGGVAHDFNNLLAVIQGNACLMREGGDPAGEGAGALEEIIAASERAAGLTRQLLAFNRQQPMHFEVVDLRECLAGVSRMVERLVGEHIRVETATGSEPLRVRADTGMVEQVLLNLAVNARDAMRSGGVLRLAGERRVPAAGEEGPGRVCLTVSDTGAGIDPAHLPRLFEPFFTTKETGKGTGLGLATVFGIVEQHGGRVEVESAPGRGSIFTVLLPLAPESGETARKLTVPAATFAPVARPGTRKTILLVEDERMVRLIEGRILAMGGYRVLEAESGREALEVWARQGDEVDLLLTDIVMPEGISGHDLAMRLRAERPGLKVIYTSGYTAETFEGDTVFPEGVAFLGKPFKPEALLGELRRAFDEEEGLSS